MATEKYNYDVLVIGAGGAVYESVKGDNGGSGGGSPGSGGPGPGRARPEPEFTPAPCRHVKSCCRVHRGSTAGVDRPHHEAAMKKLALIMGA